MRLQPKNVFQVCVPLPNDSAEALSGSPNCCRCWKLKVDRNGLMVEEVHLSSSIPGPQQMGIRHSDGWLSLFVSTLFNSLFVFSSIFFSSV